MPQLWDRKSVAQRSEYGLSVGSCVISKSILILKSTRTWSDDIHRCNRIFRQIQSEMTNLENKTSRIEKSLAQVVDQMAQIEELSKEITDGMHSVCDSLN